MAIFYHSTSCKNEYKILKEGLKTGNELGLQNYHGNIPTDNNYVYISKKKPQIDIIDNPLISILIIELPDKFPLKRDYDTRVFFENENTNFAQCIEKGLILASIPEDKRLKLSNNPTEYRKFVDCLTEDEWDAIFGYYRTKENIPSNYIRPTDPIIYPPLNRHGVIKSEYRKEYLCRRCEFNKCPRFVDC